MIYVNKIENRTTFKIKAGYYLEISMLETMELLGSKITKDEHGESLPRLEITKVVLVHCNFVNNDYQQGQRALYTFFPNKSLSQLLDISSQNFIF